MKRGKNRHFGRFFKNFLLYFRKPAVCLVFFMQKIEKYQMNLQIYKFNVRYLSGNIFSSRVAVCSGK